MFLYNHSVEFQLSNCIDKDSITLIQDDTIKESSFEYVLKFYNNQDREIKLQSNKNFTTSFLKSQKWIFTVKDVLSFAWDNSQNEIKYTMHEYGTEKLLEYWLSQVVFPIYLTLHKSYYFLHSGAVVIEDKPVIFMANSYGGKSTLTNHFLQKGHSLITDDKLGTFYKDNKFYCVSSHPHHRPFRDIENLGLVAKNFDTKVRVLEDIYILNKTDAESDITFSKLKGIEKFKQLRYGSEIEFSFLFKRGVEYLLKLLTEIDVYTVTVPWDLDRLDEVYEVIIEHQKNLKKSNNEE